MKEVAKQTILITGATDGIGELTAKKLAGQGAHLLIHGRNSEKLDRVAKEIQEETGNLSIKKYLADFASLENVRELAEKVLSDHPSLDVLINNAGLGFEDERQESEDGYELRFAVNYLAPFLLTQLLLPAIKKGAPSRIVNVSSAGQQPIDFDDVMLEHNYSATRAYRQSKLALIMFTIDLAEKLKDDNITVNSLHPGTYLNTKMVREADINPLGKAETGADAELYLATAPELENVTGKYFDRKKESRALDQAYDHEAREKLWKRGKEWTGLNEDHRF
ncbi:MAG TPA: SDR family oxidoreductase [Balneolaceae bacterium]|nr:SDR family oxidoreductase [Balneolaceae bacterium]